MKITNLMPHPVTVGGHTIQVDGRLPRVAENEAYVGTLVPTTSTAGRSSRASEVPSGANAWRWQPAWSDAPLDGITVAEVTLGGVTGLPDPVPGTLFVVARMVAEAAPARGDLLIPGRQIRDERGRIVGAESLARLPGRPSAIDTWGITAREADQLDRAPSPDPPPPPGWNQDDWDAELARPR